MEEKAQDRMSSTMSEVRKILVSLSETEVVVEPGGVAQLLVTMTNRQEGLDRLTLEIEGVDVEWYAIPVPAVNLAPGGQTTERVLFKLGRSSENRAGAYPFLVRVQAMETGELGVAQATLVIRPFSSLQVDLDPKRAVATFFGPLNEFDVSVSNLGNAEITLDLYANDPEDGCAYEFDSDRITLKPGSTSTVPLSVRPKNLSILGGMRLYGFTVSARAVEDSYVHANAHGQVEKRALISPLMGIFLLLLILAGLVTWYFWPKPPELAAINTFSSSSSHVDAGQDITLSWDVSHAQQIIIKSREGKGGELAVPGEQKATVGSVIVRPAAPETTYFLVVRGAGKDQTRSLRILVTPPPPPPRPSISAFTADPPAIHMGEQTVLAWKARGMKEFILDPGGLHMSKFDQSHSVSPDQDMQFTLQAVPENENMAPAVKSVKVHVVPKDVCLAQIDRFAASAYSVYIGDKVRLRWRTLYAPSVRIDADHGDPVGGVANPGNGMVEVRLTDTTTFTLSASDSSGKVVSKSVTIQARERPAVPVPTPEPGAGNNGPTGNPDGGTASPAPGGN
jgi:hypothetical protein